MLCSLYLISITGTVTAQKQGYSVENYDLLNSVTVDGAWTNPSEWTDAEERQLDGDLDAIFRVKKITELRPFPPALLHQYYLIEFFDDTTSDVGDYLRICFAAAYGAEPAGGSSPQDDCYRWDYVGHGTSFSSYKGDGTAWAARSVRDVQIEDTIGTSPLSDTPHLIIEASIQIEVLLSGQIQPSGGEPPVWWIRIAVYDESNSGAGEQAWPSGSVDVPDDWGLMEFTNEVIPEFPTWIIIPLFVTVTLTVIIWRKRLTKNGTPI